MAAPREVIGPRLGRTAEAVRKVWQRAIERPRADLDFGPQSESDGM